jgi:hypothetical protein
MKEIVLSERDHRAQPSPRTGPPPVELSGHIGSADADRLCACVTATAARDPSDPICYDVAAVESPDVGTVDALARMALTARRLGRRLEIRGTRPNLGELLALAGLEGSAVEVVGQTEEWEEALGIEEERDPRKAVAAELEHLE